MISFFIFILGSFGPIMFIVANIIAFFHYIVIEKGQELSVTEIWFRWIILLPFGVTEIYSAIMHTRWGPYTAMALGWNNFPCQYEVSAANLSLGILGVLAFKAEFKFRLAAVISASCWLWGTVLGHIFHMNRMHYFVSGYKASWFWLDAILPFMLIFLIVKLQSENSSHFTNN